MNNFGVIELASTKTTNAPGWAYVPDVSSSATAAAAAAAPHHQHQPTNRKRARTGGANLSYADLSARQEAKIRRELESLDRDAQSHQIPVPPKPTREAAARQQKRKHTPNVRRILQSQKTFANHLDDFVALEGGGGSNHNNNNNAHAAAGAATGTGVAAVGGSSRRAPQQQQEQQRGSRAPSTSTSTATGKGKGAMSVKQEDTEMADAAECTTTAQRGNSSTSSSNTFLAPYTRPAPDAHPSDDDPLLASRVPAMPTDAELRALTRAPPLSYLEARAGWTDHDRRYPGRAFCEVCGYWGRVKCMKCGVRVCALDCLETHREECATRYGL